MPMTQDSLQPASYQDLQEVGVNHQAVKAPRRPCWPVGCARAHVCARRRVVHKAGVAPRNNAVTCNCICNDLRATISYTIGVKRVNRKMMESRKRSVVAVAHASPTGAAHDSGSKPLKSSTCSSMRRLIPSSSSSVAWSTTHPSNRTTSCKTYTT